MKFVSIFASLCLASLASAQTQGVILQDGNDEFSYGATVNSNGISTGLVNLPSSSISGGAVRMNWNLDLGPTRLSYAFAGNWFYRVDNDSRERNPANYLSRTTTNNTAEYEFRATNANGLMSDLTARYCYQLTDTGLNSSLITTWLCFNNSGQNTYNIETFFAMDLDLMGTFGGDQGLPLQNLSAGKLITTVEGGDTGMMLGPGAVGSGLGLNSQILSLLTNSSVNSWNPDIGAGGSAPADLEDLMQFHNIVPPGQQVCVPMYIGVGINNQIPTLPEPASLTALALGAVVLMRRRK